MTPQHIEQLHISTMMMDGRAHPTGDTLDEGGGNPLSGAAIPHEHAASPKFSPSPW